MVWLEVWGVGCDPRIISSAAMRAAAPAAVDSVLLNIDVTGSNLRTVMALCQRGIDLALWIVLA